MNANLVVVKIKEEDQIYHCHDQAVEENVGQGDMNEDTENGKGKGLHQGAAKRLRDTLTVTEIADAYKRHLHNGTEITDGKSHEELQSIASEWGGAWHSDATAGNGYPILKWQFERGDYSEICGHSTTNAIQGIEAPDGKANGIYDLKGRKVTTPTRGIYIIDGKKRIYR